MTESRRGRWAFALASAAVACALALIPAAFVVPVYSTQSAASVGQSAGASASVAHGGASLIAVNGASPGLLILITLPAMLAALAWLGLHRTCSGRAASGQFVATLAMVVLAVLMLLTGLSIGVELLPVLVLLLVARKLTPTGTAHLAS